MLDPWANGTLDTLKMPPCWPISTSLVFQVQQPPPMKLLAVRLAALRSIVKVAIEQDLPFDFLKKTGSRDHSTMALEWASGKKQDSPP
jgi:hypothetical protein